MSWFVQVLRSAICLVIILVFGRLAWADGYFDQGVKCYGQHNYQSASRCFEQATKAAPSDSNAYYYLALSYQQMSDWVRAKSTYKIVIQRFPGTQAAQLSTMALSRLDPNFVRKLNPSPNSQMYGLSNASQDEPSLPAEDRVYFTHQGNNLLIDAEVNNRQIKMFFDTGAEVCVLGKNHLQQLGIGLPTGAPNGLARGVGGGGMVATWTMPVDIKVGHIVRHNFPIMVQDTLLTEPLLGQSFFRDFEYTIDQGDNSIHFKRKSNTAAGAAAANSNEVPFQREGNEMVVNVEVNGRSCPMYFDTGAEGIVFSKRNLQQLGVPIPEDVSEEVHTGVAGLTTGLGFTVNRMRLGPVDKSNVKVSAVDQLGVGRPLLGQTFYSDWQYTIDNQRNVIRFMRR